MRAPTPSAAAELAVPDIFELKEKINNYRQRYRNSLKKKIEIMRLRYEKCMQSRIFKEPTRKINDNYLIIDTYIKRIENKIKFIQKEKQTKYIELITKLDTLSPLKTLLRGYSLTEKDNEIIKSAKELEKNDEINIKFYDGEKTAKIVN